MGASLDGECSTDLGIKWRMQRDAVLHKFNHRFRYLLFMLLFFLDAGRSVEALTSVKLELKWLHQFQFAGFYMAKEKGFYRQQGLEVDILERNKQSSPLEDVLSGKVQFGISDSTIIKSYLQGKPVVILAAIYQHSPLVLMTLKKNKIVSPLELKGKRVMHQRDVDDSIISAMFAEFNLSKKDYTFVPHTFDDNALIKGQADAVSVYLGNQVYLMEKKGVDVTLIDPRNYGIDFYGDLIFTSRSYFKANKNIALKFREASIEGWKYAMEHPDEAIDLILKKYNRGKSRKALEYEARVIREMIAPDLIEIGHLNPHRLDRVADIYRKFDHIKSTKALSPLIYTHYLNRLDIGMIVFWVFLIAFAFAMVIFLLLIFNFQLKKRVREQNRILLTEQVQIKKYLNIINHYVLSLQVNEQAEIIASSAEFRDKFLFQSTELHHKNFFDLLDFSMDPVKKEQLLVAMKRLKNFSGETILKSNDNKSYAVHFFIEPVMEAKPFFILVFRDLTYQKMILEKSETDALTGLANRYKFDKLLAQEYNRFARYGNPLSFAIIDIDHFKKINDQYGHIVGDKVLQQFAHVIGSHLRKTDILCRWGGEEFALLMPATDISHANQLCEKLRKLIETHVFEEIDKLTASFGLTELQSGESEHQLLLRADQALYQAKEAGRNRVIVRV